MFETPAFYIGLTVGLVVGAVSGAVIGIFSAAAVIYECKSLGKSLDEAESESIGELTNCGERFR
ncbi:MAG: hypothetical protein NT069_29305 [Planctomycetota bacterium]|nr:hypothetical protein [Planctomycetota bacterium]